MDNGLTPDQAGEVVAQVAFYAENNCELDPGE
ncbi:hypothetical protein AGR4A_pAt10256 [Agrobacterium tumefaciens str. B6]|uniref:Uncharacterized protein n=1 Tax=Agrobacterium tumefaciens str. B6 TaxID=1183423 RepID=A0A822VB54_AGRTU|nr:hypothetical protein AGR4A_pAt10256 [Agrobacterium tumefaciens str. B6]